MRKNKIFILLLPIVAIILLTAAGLFSGNADVNWSHWQHDPIFQLRLIRILTALTAGAALSLSGMTLQTVLHNPLAEPFTLGISAGAGVGAAVAFILHLHLLTFWAVPFMALLGALLLLGAVLIFSRGKNAEHMLLSGVIAGTVASSILMYLVSISQQDELANLAWWMLGDLQAAEEKILYPASFIIIISTLFLRLTARELNAVALGDETAWALGVNAGFFRIVFILTASLLAALTAALTGLIAFAGLIVPHLVRKVLGSDHHRIVLPAALWGGAFLLACDILSKSLSSSELPIGVMTSSVGGIMFIFILNSRGKISCR